MKKLLVVNLFIVLTLTISYAQTPAGNNQDIQFNNNGSFGGSSYLKWNGSFLSLLDLGTTSAKLYFNSGSGDHSYIYSENFGTNLNRLVIETADDGDQDYTVFRNKHWKDGIKDVFEVRRSWVKANANFYVESGNVGIGTITPDVKLEVEQNSSTDAVGLRLTNSGWTSNMSTSLEFKTGRVKSVATSKISSIMNGSGNAGDRLGFFVQENSDTNPNNNPLEEKLSLLPNGNVGIGTITPNVKLEVKQNSSTDAVGLRLTNSGWASNMSTSIEFKTGYIKSVPTSKISSIMNGSGNAGDRLGFFVQENSDTNPNNNPLEEKLSLLPNGDVGIGSTTSTSARLHIKQSINDATGGIALQDTGGRFIKIYGEGSAGRQVIGTYATLNPLAFELNGVERMRILSNGNLGIGVTNPEQKLHVAGNIKTEAASSAISIVGTGTGDYNGGNLILSALGVNTGNEYASSWVMTHRGTDGNASFGIQRRNLTGNYKGTLLYYKDGLGWSFRTAGNHTSATVTEKLIIRADGDVGIGTDDTKGYKLAVKGKIITEEVKVAIYPWSDFVFENDYNLPTLKEVEQHIKEKGHLKDIPSATDVSKNGIFLGEMNAKLLQKIEELTLYTIQQEKVLTKIIEEKEVALKNQKEINKNLEEKLKTQDFRLQKIEALLNTKTKQP